ncbi:MAG: aminotransferase class I/II-fold pyridoxal phosphate-dependent enzyme, partial [Alphaproteobacteria bacterium]|nr:aminotransferase class I/II-fold pyridoxal phosphate-dependent enzyme [Alphaproteobacteria bacterium]
MVELPLHGGELDWARRHFPKYIGAWLDLSTGVNPHSYPIPPIAVRDWSHLPSRAAENDLIAAAADYYGVESENILPSAGSQALIQILPALAHSGVRQVEILAPSFSEYARIFQNSGFDVRLIDVFAAEIPPPAAPYRIVVSPNNPTGRNYDPAQLLAWAAECAARGGFLWVDEAFADVAENSVVPYVGRQKGLVVARSFGKFFGLAGVRLGFLCATPDFIALARAKIGPWAVSGPAL